MRRLMEAQEAQGQGKEDLSAVAQVAKQLEELTAALAERQSQVERLRAEVEVSSCCAPCPTLFYQTHLATAEQRGLIEN
jgi:hypothetical protein